MAEMWIDTVYEPAAMKTTAKGFSGPHAGYLDALMVCRNGLDYFTGMPLEIIQQGQCKDSFAQVLNSAFPAGLLSVGRAVTMMNAACFGH